MVVLGHTITQVFDLREYQYGSLLDRLIVLFNMPLFTILAGYCGYTVLFKLSTFKDIVLYFRKQFLRLILPTWTVGILFAIIGRFDFAKLIQEAAMGFGYWYLAMLFYICCLSAIIKFIINNIIKNSNANITFIAFCLSLSLFFLVRWLWIGEMIPFFMIGLILRKYYILERVIITPKRAFFITAITAVVYSLCEKTSFLEINMQTFYNRYFYDFISSGTLWVWLLRVVLATFMSISVIALFKLFERGYKFLTTCGEYSLSIYLFSNLFFAVFAFKPIHAIIVSSSFYQLIRSTEIFCWLGALTTFIVISLSSYYITILCKKKRVTRFLFMGKY